MADQERKFDYELDTKGGKDLHGFTQAEILQAGWYALQSCAEQNEKNTAIRTLAKKDPRFKSIVEEARKQIAASKKKG